MFVSELSRKEAAEEMAEVITSTGINAAGIMERLKAFDNSETQPLLKKALPGNYIGIWKEDPERNHYVRDKKLMANWIKWADQNRIPVSTHRKRVLLTGESVARGSFYGNECSPARVLEHILTGIAGEDAIEVVDIAKSGMELDEMTGLLKNALVLKPDQVVIMAGNNFFYKLYKDFLTTALQDDAAPELSGGWLKKRIDESLEQLTLSFLQELQELFTARQIPVLFVIPAFNLADWKVTSLEKLPPSLPAKDLSGWEKLLETAHKAVAAKNYMAVQTAVSQLLDLCPVHPTPHELLGEAALAQQDWDTARKHLEIARDFTLLFKSIGKPRILSVVRNTILSQAGQYGVHVTDLSAVFGQQPGHPIPDRNLFMDYCHMNMKGIQLSMLSVAASLTESLGLPKTERSVLEKLAGEIQPAAEAVCMAHIYAAIHNAHYGQDYPIVRYHIETAFACLPELATRFCKLYIEMATLRLSSPLTRSFVKMMDDIHIRIDQYPEAVFHPVNGKLLDIILTNAMNDVLAEKGVMEPEATAALRLAEHAVELGPVNLLESFYSRQTYDNYYDDGAHYYKSRDTRSVFSFFTHAKTPLVCELVYRVKDQFPDPVRISINGKALTELPATREWQTGFLRIEQQLLTEGENKLEITWPVCDNCIANKETSFVSDIIELLTPVRGELHSFSIWA